MSQKSIIFLDIDGTLVNTDANPEFIPESDISISDKKEFIIIFVS